MNKLFWIGYCLMWVSVSISISIGIYYTHDNKCLWFFLIPALIRINIKTKEDSDDNKEV